MSKSAGNPLSDAISGDTSYQDSLVASLRSVVMCDIKSASFLVEIWVGGHLDMEM